MMRIVRKTLHGTCFSQLKDGDVFFHKPNNTLMVKYFPVYKSNGTEIYSNALNLETFCHHVFRDDETVQKVEAEIHTVY
jgi:hypothetical protein